MGLNRPDVGLGAGVLVQHGARQGQPENRHLSASELSCSTAKQKFLELPQLAELVSTSWPLSLVLPLA